MAERDPKTDENSERITQLMSEYRNDQKWLKEAIQKQSAKLDELTTRVGGLNATVHNGLKDRQEEIAIRLSKVEDVLGSVVTHHDLDKHKESEEKLQSERWTGLNRRREDKYKTVAMAVSITTAILSFASVVAVFLRLGAIL